MSLRIFFKQMSLSEGGPLIAQIQYAAQAEMEWLQNFSRDQLLKLENELPNDESFPFSTYQDAHRLGLFRLPLPLSHGGQNLSVSDLAWVVRHLSYASPSVAATFIGNLLGLSAVLLYASPALKNQILGELSPEKLELFSFAMTEGGAGSDLMNIATEARASADGFLLNGEKNFITNATYCRRLVVFARECDGAGKDLGISCFYVDGQSLGLTRGEVMTKVAWKKANTGTLLFKDVKLPPDSRLGLPGEGLRILTHCLNRSKTLLGAMGVGIADRALDLSTERLQNTERFQKSLLEQPALRHQLSRHFMEKEAAWLLVCKAASTWDAGEDATTESSMAKLFSGKMAVTVAAAAMEYFGARGLFHNFEISRLWADAKAIEIIEGPSLVQELLIARNVLPRKKSAEKDQGQAFVISKSALKKAS